MALTNAPLPIREITATLASADLVLASDVMADAKKLINDLIEAGAVPEELKIRAMSVRGMLATRQQDMINTHAMLRREITRGREANALANATDEELAATVAY